MLAFHGKLPGAVRRRFIGCAVLSVATGLPLLLSGCEREPSAPERPEVARSSVDALEEAPGRKEYACFFSVRESSDPLWYRYANGTTRFPRSAEAADGATATYRYRSYDGSGQVVRVVRCAIPRTERAVQIMDRRLSVKRAKKDSGGVVLMDVELEGLVVRACQYGGEYPNCEPAPGGTEPETDVLPCLDWADCNGGDSGTDPIDTGGALPGGEEPEPCDPRLDPSCLQPLTSTDSLVIQNALAQYLRTAFTDTAAERNCAEMKAGFDSVFAVGAVFRGGSTDSTHYGFSHQGKIHFDPDVLDGAAAGDTAFRREIAITALHEVGHVWGKSHTQNGEPYGDSLLRDYYISEPFRYLNPGPNSCVPR